MHLKSAFDSIYLIGVYTFFWFSIIAFLRLGIIRRVVIPLASPGMVVTALFSFIWSWNEFMFALIMTKSSAYTLPVMIASWRGAGVIWGGVSASALIAIIPSLLLAIFLQKYLVSGLTFGMLKG